MQLEEYNIHVVIRDSIELNLIYSSYLYTYKGHDYYRTYNNLLDVAESILWYDQYKNTICHYNTYSKQWSANGFFQQTPDIEKEFKKELCN